MTGRIKYDDMQDIVGASLPQIEMLEIGTGDGAEESTGAKEIK
ncbi:MAG: hypothetical protein WC649_03925 [Desulfobacteria bacterium]